MLPDQDVDKVGGIFVPFFGREAYTPTGPASLARAARVPIIPFFMIWMGRKYRVRIGRPIVVPHTERKKEDLLEGTLLWSKVFEEVIRAHPDQWVWIHRRWRTTPERLEERRKRRAEKERA